MNSEARRARSARSRRVLLDCVLERRHQGRVLLRRRRLLRRDEIDEIVCEFLHTATVSGGLAARRVKGDARRRKPREPGA
jgi:hypothetical protein